MAAALTGCGKTILANQFLWDFARGGAKVVLVTTEQTPAVLIPRVISNTTSTPFSDFVKSSAINLSDIEKTTTIPNIPAYMWTDPNKAARMQVVEQVLIDNVKFVDWTGSNKHSITEHLACEIDALRTTGWIPDVIIFDWLGGALEGTDTPDKLRLIFKQGADFFATYCQTNNYLGIMFQQLAQGLALNKKIVHVNMLAEAKNTVEKFDGFLGISGMHEAEKNIDDAIVTKPKLMRKQYIHVGKTRNGEGGVCGVAQEFVYQRFGDWEKVNQLTQPQ